MTSLDEDLAFAYRLADAARAESMPRFRSQLRSWQKSDGSIVTEADQAVEDALRRLLAAERPNDAILGEERAASGTGRRRWIIDPIDGTVAFAAGLPEWITLIALEIDGRVAVGVCDQPTFDRRYWAMAGGGAFVAQGPAEPRRLRVSSAKQLAGARANAMDPQWLKDDRARRRAAALAAVTTATRMDEHPALQVASGGYDLCAFFTAGPWDLAAPAIVVEEAGGRFSDLEGARTLTAGAVFSNGLVHDQTLSAFALADEGMPP